MKNCLLHIITAFLFGFQLLDAQIVSIETYSQKEEPCASVLQVKLGGIADSGPYTVSLWANGEEVEQVELPARSFCSVTYQNSTKTTIPAK